MNSDQTVPFLLRYEEAEPGGDTIDALDNHYYYDHASNGMAVRMTFLPWDACATLQAFEV